MRRRCCARTSTSSSPGSGPGRNWSLVFLGKFSSPSGSKWQDYYPPTDLEEDLEAGFMGLPFIEPASEHEWEDHINWDELN